MSLVDIDSWLTEYESCEKLSHTILAEITQREQHRPQNYPHYTRKIQLYLDQFEKELHILKLKLDTSAGNRSITFEETERRQRLLEILQSKLQQSKRNFTTTTRSDLLPLSSKSIWQTDDEDITNSSRDLQPVKQTQIQIMEDQDRGLDVLSKTISRQKELASRLGQEVEEQSDLIDNIAENMDRIDDRVHGETENIGRVSRQDSTWGYWLIIIGLLVAILIVLMV